MNRPSNPVEQCPSCHLQSINDVCAAGKRRIQRNENGELYKAIDCTFWIERKIEIGQDSEKRCPTCGHFINITIQEPTTIPVQIGGEVSELKLDAGDTVTFNWGPQTESVTPSSKPPEQVEQEDPTPTASKRRRGFKDMPKAKKGSGPRRKE